MSSTPELTDYAKLRKMPFYYGYSVLTATAVLCTVGAPLVLFSAELGIDKDRIGLIGGILPFFQILGIAALPVILRFGTKRVAALALIARYLFLLPLFFAPLFIATPSVAFTLIFSAIICFAICRTLSEAAAVPWSQEFIPRLVRGQISGKIALAYLPTALIGSFLIQLWLDGQHGIERFYPVFVIGILIGIGGGLTLFGLGGGAPRPTKGSGLDAIRQLRVPLRDRNFLAFLYSSGTQYLVFSALNIFMLLFFRERLGISSGQIVLMAALVPVGSAAGSYAAGWFIDRHGTRAIRITLQSLQVAMLLSLPFLHDGIPGVEILVGLVFFLFGFLVQGAMVGGSVYMLNYVPPTERESYMALAYSSDGIFGGGLTVLAGILVQYFEHNGLNIGTAHFGGYEVLFVAAALVTASSAAVFALLREEGATGVRDFLGQFSSGNPLRALWGIQRFSSFTSEQRRRDLAYGFGGTGSTLAQDELISALSDPSFDVRHEAIRALGRLPATPKATQALEDILTYDGLIELQYAALDSLGLLGSKGSAEDIARFLGDGNRLLRSRAARSLGDIRATSYLPEIRKMLAEDVDVDCRLAAASALGKFGDRQSVETLVAIYAEQASDDNPISEPRSKVVLLAISKILRLEEQFARNWRREQRMPGYCLPALLSRLAKTLDTKSKRNEAQRVALQEAAAGLGTGSTAAGFAALRGLRPLLAASPHEDAPLVVALIDGTRDITEAHRALMVLLAVAARHVRQPPKG
ncbi:MFS transporter [Devosia sp.]|uniref:MFS transporter n=1 Tax=Devosia sp. TaxID=1871048 RepID=UPI001AD3157C|nr:MFS transporter [Devosia sp.]MBN9332398.1 MFS transporter [Devosia sp.]